MHSSHLAVKGGALLFKQIQSKAEIRGGDFTHLKICLLYRYVGVSHMKVVWESLFKSWYELQVLHIMQLLKWIRKKLNQPSILWASKCFVFHHYNMMHLQWNSLWGFFAKKKVTSSNLYFALQDCSLYLFTCKNEIAVTQWAVRPFFFSEL